MSTHPVRAVLRDGSPVTDGDWFFQIPNMASLFYVLAGLATDSFLEAVRELRQVPDFQRHEGKKALNNVYDKALALDNRLCALATDNAQLEWLERAKDRFYGEELKLDIFRYHSTVKSIIGRTAYPYAESYASAVIARSLATIAAEWQEDVVFAQFGSVITTGSNTMVTPTEPLARYRLYSTRPLVTAWKGLDKVYARSPELQENIRYKHDEDTIRDGGRILVKKVLNVERIIKIVEEEKNRKE